MQQQIWIRRLINYLSPNPGTLLLLFLFLWVQNTGAAPWSAPVAAPSSASTINYQGRLFNSSGIPLDASVNLEFSLYSQASGGSPVWGPETHSGVAVNDGLFSVLLGSQVAIPLSAIEGDLWLETKVNGETLLPREQLGAVPVAMTVRDGGVKSRALNLSSDTACLAGHATVNLAGSFQPVNIPALTLNFSLEKASKVLIWTDGLAKFNQTNEVDILLNVDGVSRTSTYSEVGNDLWFNIKGERLLNLNSGSHSLSLQGSSFSPGTLTVHGVGPYQTCINYIVLGE